MHLYLLQVTLSTPTAAGGHRLPEDPLPMDLLPEATLLMDLLPVVTLLVDLLPAHFPDLQHKVSP